MVDTSQEELDVNIVLREHTQQSLPIIVFAPNVTWGLSILALVCLQYVLPVHRENMHPSQVSVPAPTVPREHTQLNQVKPLVFAHNVLLGDTALFLLPPLYQSASYVLLGPVSRGVLTVSFARLTRLHPALEV